jgi:ketosteroid isomerase-like protein
MTVSTWSRHLLALASLALPSVAAGPLAAQAGPTPERTSFDTAAVLASARPDIEAANAAWIPGLRRRDAASIVAAYADSGIFVSPDGTVVRGRAAVAAMYAARFPRLREIRAGAVVQDGLAAAGPALVYEWGHAWLEMAPAAAGGAPVRSGGAYLTVWRRESDGHWHIARNLAL